MYSASDFKDRWSKDEINEALVQLQESPDQIRELFKLLRNDDQNVVFLVSWLLLNASKLKVFSPYFTAFFPELILLLKQTKNTSFLRSGLRYLIEVGIPSEVEEELIDYSFLLLDNRKQEVAILNSAFSIIETVLKRCPEYIQPLYEATLLVLDYQPVSFKHKFKKFIAKYEEDIRFL